MFVELYVCIENNENKYIHYIYIYIFGKPDFLSIHAA